MTADGFRFAYEPGVLRVGEGAVGDLGTEVAATGNERALVVCGRTVGSTPGVIDPVREGLGDRLAGVFDETTPEKRLSTAVQGAERLATADADAIVALGGGSSLDVAKAIAVVAATAQDGRALGAAFERTGTLPVPDAVPGLVVVPTTLAGADLSQLAGLTATSSNGLVGTDVSGGFGGPGLLPDALVYDPALFATTPRSVLTGSAMNGFDKGIEALYARNATPVTDGTATRGLALLRDALPTLATDDPAMAEIVRGTVLVQYGISRPDGTTLSLIHAFGHGLTAHSTVQQGVAHAVVAPHALAYLFEHVDGRRALLADALGVDSQQYDQAVADGVVDAVEAVRNALGLPGRLRDIDGVERSALDAMAETTAGDSLLGNAPAGLEPLYWLEHGRSFPGRKRCLTVFHSSDRNGRYGQFPPAGTTGRRPSRRRGSRRHRRDARRPELRGDSRVSRRHVREHRRRSCVRPDLQRRTRRNNQYAHPSVPRRLPRQCASHRRARRTTRHGGVSRRQRPRGGGARRDWKRARERHRRNSLRRVVVRPGGPHGCLCARNAGQSYICVRRKESGMRPSKKQLASIVAGISVLAYSVYHFRGDAAPEA